MPHTPDDDFTELIDANIDRVDLVDKAANGLPFLMAKAAADGGPAGLFAPDLVRDLIGKSAAPAPEAADTVTMTGTPGALAQLIHKAGGRLVDAPITKDADTMATEADLDPTVVLAEPEGDAPGDVNTPGSPAWEAVDAATARKWTAILARAKSALGVMADRELLESAAGDAGDFDAALDLDDAACAIDYAISVLAPFAVDEESEVIRGTAELDAVGKALGDFDAAPLDVIESLTQVAKAGRTLSAANENAIRNAVESLQKVLASLPAAPDTQDSGRPVAKKETDMPETGTAPETVETPAEPIGKADAGAEGKAPMVAVYDAKGKLVGIVDPTEITPISGADAAEEPAEAAEAAPAPVADDLTPAPAAEVGTPTDDEDVAKEAAPVEDAAPADAGDVTKTTDTDSDDILKSSDIRDMVKGLLDEHSAGQMAQLTKTGEAIVELADLVETLKGQVKALEEQPAVPQVFANGAQPPAHLLRGQDRGAQPVDMAKARELKKSLYGGTATEQNEAAKTMQTAAIEALQAIHRGA
ncbi:hypothetical protein [Streptomyces sp. NPDC056683]|uniref:hypothetical protein n=1 Tax=Streptomyces sp. NPDC056683 TaxID=3345910 RepID=UPI0036CCA7E5